LNPETIVAMIGSFLDRKSILAHIITLTYTITDCFSTSLLLKPIELFKIFEKEKTILNNIIITL